jgi:AcrR family transcriptional regulator
MAAIDRNGTRRVTMSDVCRAAKVSRGTIYRYFPTRDALFTALGSYSIALYRKAVQQAVDDEPDLDRRFAVVLDALRRQTGDGEGFRRVYRTEPDYMLRFFHTNWAEIVAVIHDAILPAFASGADDRAPVAAELLARHALTRQLLPDGPLGDTEIVAVVDAYAR